MAKILIAEDERDIRDLVTFTLKYAGFEVLAVANGAEAVSVAREEMPDLILMDGRMPVLSGYDACEQIKADAKTGPIPVVFLSAKGQEAEIQAGLKAGAVEYILKPFAPSDLIARVHQLLEQYGRKKEEDAG